MKAIIAGYTAAPSDPQAREAYYSRLVSVPGADGLEFGWTTATPPDLAGALDQLPREWSVTLNDITATFQASVTSPRSGLASPDAEGRAVAVALAGQLAAFVRSVNDRQGRRAVAAVEIHSAPGFSNRVLQPDQAAFTESLAELAGLDWDGAEVLVEHCDAFVDGQPPAKGFLRLDQEIAALAGVAGSAIGLSLNWGRSAIELRTARPGHRACRKRPAIGQPASGHVLRRLRHADRLRPCVGRLPSAVRRSRRPRLRRPFVADDA